MHRGDIFTLWCTFLMSTFATFMYNIIIYRSLISIRDDVVKPLTFFISLELSLFRTRTKTFYVSHATNQRLTGTMQQLSLLSDCLFFNSLYARNRCAVMATMWRIRSTGNFSTPYCLCRYDTLLNRNKNAYNRMYETNIELLDKVNEILAQGKI